MNLSMMMVMAGHSFHAALMMDHARNCTSLRAAYTSFFSRKLKTNRYNETRNGPKAS